MSEDATEELVAKMSADAKAALALLSGDWQAGPDLADEALISLNELREIGLIERSFADMGPPASSETIDGFSISLGACWWFRLTDSGALARNALAQVAK